MAVERVLEQAAVSGPPADVIFPIIGLCCALALAALGLALAANFRGFTDRKLRSAALAKPRVLAGKKLLLRLGGAILLVEGLLLAGSSAIAAFQAG